MSSAPIDEQDYTVTTKAIWELWQLHKMTTESTKKQLLQSRNMGAAKLIAMLDAHAAEEEREFTEAALATFRVGIEGRFTSFRGHPLIDVFMAQWQGAGATPQTRYKSLLLRGESRSGKTLRAMSLFGSEATLPVNCQGCAPNLPSIRAFARNRHHAILWDEIDEQQVLKNKMVFQSPLQMVTLGQSQCNAFAYPVFLYAVPMLLCSNTFSMTHHGQKVLSEEDRNWLQDNVIEVRLPPGLSWYASEEA